MTADPILDDLFHACAWQAFIAEARAVQGWPDPEKTRQRCYQMFEEQLAVKSGSTSHQPLALPVDSAYSPPP